MPKKKKKVGGSGGSSMADQSRAVRADTNNNNNDNRNSSMLAPPTISKSAGRPQPQPQQGLGLQDPTSAADLAKMSEAWKVKNARAKELIMSTLMPGSEPWRIAEPLENASDIWKALEEKYARKDALSEAPAPRKLSPPQTFTAPTGAMGSSSSSAISGSNVELPTSTLDHGKDHTSEAAGAGAGDGDATWMLQSKQVFVNAVKQFYKSLPSQDQRLLWALLHGGKLETNEWFYGKSELA